MTLIKSISGIRGTVGGAQAGNLTPPDVVKFTTAYARLAARRKAGKKLTIVVGRAPGFRARWSPTWSKAPCWRAVRM